MMLPHIFGTFKARIIQSYAIPSFWNKNRGNRSKIKVFRGTLNSLKFRIKPPKFADFHKNLRFFVFLELKWSKIIRIVNFSLFQTIMRQKTGKNRIFEKLTDLNCSCRLYRRFSVPTQHSVKLSISNRLPPFLFQNGRITQLCLILALKVPKM